MECSTEDCCIRSASEDFNTGIELYCLNNHGFCCKKTSRIGKIVVKQIKPEILIQKSYKNIAIGAVVININGVNIQEMSLKDVTDILCSHTTVVDSVVFEEPPPTQIFRSLTFGKDLECPHCGYLHYDDATDGMRRNCCDNGRFLGREDGKTDTMFSRTNIKRPAIQK